MDTPRRESIRLALRRLAESYAATMAIMEATYTLLGQELALDPVDYFQRRTAPSPAQPPPAPGRPVLDGARFTVMFGGRTCFLGNTYPFGLLARLAERPGTYLSYEDLLADVWRGIRSDAAVRSAVKTLRQRLRGAGLADLAAAVDGSVRGHYGLKLPAQ